MTDTLRDRANMEILDVWKNVNRQVFGREKQQIAVFPETILPNTQRDTGTEVNVDKSIEQINKIIETKLGPLEALIDKIPQNFAQWLPRGSTEISKVFTEATLTGDVIPLWNQIVRYYKQPGLSKDSQEKIKMSVHQLEPNLKALNYGYKLAIDKVFEVDYAGQPDSYNEKMALMVMELLRAESVYKIIQEQIHSTGFNILDNEALNSAYKNNFQSLTQNEIAFLKNFSPRGSVMSTGIRNVPDFSSQTSVQRLRQIQDELGVQFPEEMLSEFRRMPMNQLNAELDKFMKDKKVPVSQASEKKYLEIMEEKNALEEDIARAGQMFNILEAEIEALKDESKAIQVAQPLPEPVIPKLGPLVANMTPVQQQAYDDRKEEIRLAKLERDIVRAHNKLQIDLQQSRDEKDTKIIQKEQDLQDLEQTYIQKSGELIFAEQNLSRFSPGAIQIKQRGTPALQEFAKLYPVEGFGKPKRARVDTRGLASMRNNYGKPEESESESESGSDEGDSSDEGGDMDFDDDRNEHYTRRPVAYY